MAVGCFQMYRGASTLFTAVDSEAWPTVKGQIVESKLEPASGDDSGYIAVVIRYTYQIGEHQYTGTSIYPGDNVSSNYRVSMVDRFPNGSSQLVHYRQNRSLAAFLQTGVHRYTFLPLLLGTFVFCLGASIGIIWQLVVRSGPPNNEGEYTFPLNHPISRIGMFCLTLLALHFALFFYCSGGGEVSFG